MAASDSHSEKKGPLTVAAKSPMIPKPLPPLLGSSREPQPSPYSRSPGIKTHRRSTLLVPKRCPPRDPQPPRKPREPQRPQRLLSYGDRRLPAPETLTAPAARTPSAAGNPNKPTPGSPATPPSCSSKLHPAGDVSPPEPPTKEEKCHPQDTPLSRTASRPVGSHPKKLRIQAWILSWKQTRRRERERK